MKIIVGDDMAKITCSIEELKTLLDVSSGSYIRDACAANSVSYGSLRSKFLQAEHQLIALEEAKAREAKEKAKYVHHPRA